MTTQDEINASTMKYIDGLKNAPINTTNKVFTVSCEITRPANVTAYAIGDIINNLADTTLPALDFSAVATGNQAIQVTSVELTSSNGSAATKLNAQVHLWNRADIQASCVDNGLLSPTYAICGDNRVAMLDDVSNVISMGANAYSVVQTEVARNAVLDAGAKLYVSVIAGNAYVPASGEKITLKIKGFLL